MDPEKLGSGSLVTFRILRGESSSGWRRFSSGDPSHFPPDAGKRRIQEWAFFLRPDRSGMVLDGIDPKNGQGQKNHDQFDISGKRFIRKPSDQGFGKKDRQDRIDNIRHLDPSERKVSQDRPGNFKKG
jgi:hypothetical protein